MANIKSVSVAVQKDIKEIQALEGNKKSIDTKNEYDKLAAYLSGNKASNGFEFGVKEKEYIAGFMIEYENKEKVAEQNKFLEEAVTSDTKENVKKIAKRTGDKKVIDTDDEAQSLLAMLKNTKGELNEADLQYIKNVLITSGYGKLLEEGSGSDAKELTPPATQEECEPQKDSKTAEAGVSDVSPSEQPPIELREPKKEVQESKSEADVPEAKQPQAEQKKKVHPPYKFAPRPSKQTKPQPSTTTSKTTNPPKQYKITERGRTFGARLASNVDSAIKSGNLEKVKSELKLVTKESAYTFFATLESATHKQIHERVGYNGTLPAVTALLRQAKEMGLENRPQYKQLQQRVNYATDRVKYEPGVKPTPQEAHDIDSAINSLLILMGRVLQ